MPVATTENAPLKALNTFGVRASAARLVEPDDPADLPGALALARDKEPVLVLGAGSNVLFTHDFPGTILHLRNQGMRVLDAGRRDVVVEAQAGENWDRFVRWTLSQGLSGLENLALIPGNVGASPVQNIGAYGVEMRERFESLSAFEIATGRLREFRAADCAFGYRDSVFKSAEAGRWVIASVRFRLCVEPEPRLDYAALRDELRSLKLNDPTPTQIADAVSAIRARKLPDPARLGNAGSFFKNPVLKRSTADALLLREPDLVSWPDRDGVKLSAAWLIDRCGLKGVRLGDAGVHAAHALVLVNHGNATGAQILELAERVRESVRERFGVSLEPEPLII